MQTQIRNYNFLIIGKSGAGKSATTRLLTGNPQITVANSLKQVTTQPRFYQGSSFPLNNHLVRFRILDIPGLDKINNRFIIRQKILQILERQKIALNGIFYVSSLTQRDTIDSQKLFRFIQQLPWSIQTKKNCLIPIFTKYDNLIIDSLDEQIRSTKLQYKQIFEKAGYSSAWSKRVYWINHTKSLDFKMKTYEEIKITHQKQVQRLVEMIGRSSKYTLTGQDIVESIKKQQKFILQKLFTKMQSSVLPYTITTKRYNLKAKIQIHHKQLQQSVTVLSASSIALFIAKALQRQLPTVYSIALMGLPIAIALLTMKETSSVLHGKKVSQQSSGVELVQAYQRLCHLINVEVENQWKELNHMIQLRAKDNLLYCLIMGEKRWKFIDLSALTISLDEEYFQSMEKKKNSLDLTQQYQTKSNQEIIENQQNHQINKRYWIKIPKFQTETIWQPEIQFQYGVRIFDESSILKQIETLRQDYYNTIKQQ